MSEACVVYNMQHLETKEKFHETQASDGNIFKDEGGPDICSSHTEVKIEPKTEDLEEDFKISTVYAESKPLIINNLVKSEAAESVEDISESQITAGDTASQFTGITEGAVISSDWDEPKVKIEPQTKLEKDSNIGTLEPHSKQTDDSNTGNCRKKSIDIEDGTFLLLTSGIDKRKVWGVRCKVLSCQTSKRDDPTLKFFKFPPRESDLYEKWISACGLEKTTIIQNAYVCSKHFYESDMGKKRLRKNVFPSKNAHNNAANSDISVLLSGKAYNEAQNMDWDDLTLEELQALEPRCASTSSVELPELTCKNCISLEKSIRFYRQKYTSLLRKHTNLKKLFTNTAVKKRLYLFRSKEQKKSL